MFSHLRVGNPRRPSTISSVPSRHLGHLEARLVDLVPVELAQLPLDAADGGPPARPSPRATPSIVTSSCVGPTPPDVKHDVEARAELAHRRGDLVELVGDGDDAPQRRRRAPRSSRARNGELVSTTLPERISLPMTMRPAVRSRPWMSSHRDRVLAEVAGADADVHHAPACRRRARARAPAGSAPAARPTRRGRRAPRPSGRSAWGRAGTPACGRGRTSAPGRGGSASRRRRCR